MRARPDRRYLWLICAIALSLGVGYACDAAAVPFGVHVTDVSPDTSCCTTESSSDPSDTGGQMDGVAADPKDPVVAYAAGEQSGVWKTTDGGADWQWSSTGLATGESNGGGASEPEPALAVDPDNGRRLLFAANDDDLGPGYALGLGGLGGLSASLDGAGHWAHVALPGCVYPSVQGVAFGGGAAYAATGCGVAVSTDPALAAWTIVHPDGAKQNESIATVAVHGNTVFACDTNSNNVYRSPDQGATWTRLRVPGASDCWSVAAVPDNAVQFVLMDQKPPKNAKSVGRFHVLLGNTSSGQAIELNGLPQPGGYPSGRPYVATVAVPGHPAGQGPGRSYEVFASDGDYLYELGSGTSPSWSRLPNMHIDQHGLAVEANYDPDHGHCGLYIANDGGVYRTLGTHAPCRVHNSVARTVMHGLHGFGSWALGLIARPTCPANATAPCPALYVGANDNGTFGSAVGGHGRAVWHDLHCCGDSGAVLTDWRLATRVVTPRGDSWQLHVSSNASPPVGSSESVTDIGTKGIDFGAQVQTFPDAHVPAKGIYFAIRTLKSGDQLIRNSAGDAHGWKALGPSFAPGAITGLQVADGGATVYVLAGAAGKVFLLGKNADGRPAWLDRSSGLTFADDLIADPFDGQVLYATDLGNPNSLDDDRIMTSDDGGQNWSADVVLTLLARANGLFRMACGPGLGDSPRLGGTVNAGSFGFRYQCTLDAVAFDPFNANLRWALLDPAGVEFSSDGGSRWLPLDVTSPIDRPTAALFDPTPDPQTHEGSLYVALHGHGLIRVDAAWSVLNLPPGPPPPPPTPPPAPPTPLLGASAISLVCPARATFPSFTVTGALAPPLAHEAVHVTVVGPQSVGTREFAVNTDASGDYRLTFNGSVGLYSVSAFYAGDIDHSASTSPSCLVPMFPPPG